MGALRRLDERVLGKPQVRKYDQAVPLWVRFGGGAPFWGALIASDVVRANPSWQAAVVSAAVCGVIAVPWWFGARRWRQAHQQQ